MRSLFSVQNNVSLITLNIAPSAWVTSLVLTLVFVFLYLLLHAQPIPSFRWRKLAWFARRRTTRKQQRLEHTPQPIYEENDDDDDPFSDDEYPPRRRHIEHTPVPPLIADYPYPFLNSLGRDDSRSRGSPKKVKSSRRHDTERRGGSSSSKMTMTALEPIDHLDASLEDFAPFRPPTPTTETTGSNNNNSRLQFGYPSAHSGFRSDDLTSETAPLEEEEEEDDSDSEASAGGYSPPAWRRLGNGDRSSGFWGRGDDLMRLLSKVAERDREHDDGDNIPSRMSSPEYASAGEGDDYYDDDDVLAQAIRTRLPGSLSPEKERSPEPEYQHQLQQNQHGWHQHHQYQRIDDVVSLKTEDKDIALSGLKQGAVRSKEDNFIRFAVRAEMQHRSEPIDAAFDFLRRKITAMTRSWASVFSSLVVATLSYAALRWLSQPAAMRPVPDLVKVAGVARSMEPLIYYSENGIQQVGDLQATGVAVWDLGESVRSSNLTSAPIIVKALDELSDSLKTLAIELTKFFANVDGDIDGILIVMDWARRELSQLQSLPTLPLSSAFDNIHNLLSNAGILENPSTGQPTVLGRLFSSLFGPSTPQRTKQTLQRTFNEFLSVLEDAVSSELQHSLALFALFEAIDHQFHNLARTVVREASLQDQSHADLLSSLWTRILGPKASEVAKYERNRLLLQNVREKTVRNKGILVEHNHKLLALKANLETLRRKLVSPLVRSVNSSTLTLDEQIRGLEDVGMYLEGVRMRQKGKLLEMLYGSGSGSGSSAATAGVGAGAQAAQQVAGGGRRFVDAEVLPRGRKEGSSASRGGGDGRR
ncbi:hypothetical protein VTJ49DRAFT_6481 [Mycothermus thermophilus]|uniref:Uncharacterized protein n=1 Tax=Humicola insolens TaxID=85995 RepID=A0ABR3VJI5_HUMIN